LEKIHAKGNILISQIRLYDYYTEDGTTTAGALNIFSDLQADNIITSSSIIWNGFEERWWHIFFKIPRRI
jgi:hypothetical protein